MVTRSWLVGGLGVVAVWATACGIPTEEYDARVKQLREAEERIAECRGRIEAETRERVVLESNAEQLRQSVKALESERSATGLTSDAARAHYQKLLADEATATRAAAARSAERTVLTTNLHDEIGAGLLSVDERGGSVRIVIPEEALFASGGASLGPPGKKVLDSVVRELQLLGSRRLLVAAFVDVGPKSKPKEELTLTVNRARRVADYCIKQGIDPTRVATAGFDAGEPIADNAVDEQRVRNRRIEVRLLEVPPRGPAPPAGTPQSDDPGL